MGDKGKTSVRQVGDKGKTSGKSRRQVRDKLGDTVHCETKG